MPTTSPDPPIALKVWPKGRLSRQELFGSVQRFGRLVEDRGIGLEDVRHPEGDVEGGVLSRRITGDPGSEEFPAEQRVDLALGSMVVPPLFGAHRGPPFGSGWLGNAPRRARHVNPLLKISCREAGHCQPCRQAGEEASPDPGDSRPEHRAAFPAEVLTHAVAPQAIADVIAFPVSDAATPVSGRYCRLTALDDPAWVRESRYSDDRCASRAPVLEAGATGNVRRR